MYVTEHKCSGLVILMQYLNCNSSQRLSCIFRLLFKNVQEKKKKKNKTILKVKNQNKYIFVVNGQMQLRVKYFFLR